MAVPSPTPDLDVCCPLWPSLTCLCPARTPSPGSLQADLPWLPFAFRLNPDSSAGHLKLWALLAPLLHHPKSPVYTHSGSALDSTLTISIAWCPSWGNLLRGFPSAALPLLHQWNPAHPSGPSSLSCPPVGSALEHLPYSSARPKWAFRMALCPSLPPIRSCVFSPKGHAKTLGALASPKIFKPPPNHLK